MLNLDRCPEEQTIRVTSTYHRVRVVRRRIVGSDHRHKVIQNGNLTGPR